MDEIRIEGLEVYAYHGVFEEEKKLGQSFLVNASLYLDVGPAGIKDDLTLSVHYGEVAHFIHSFMKEGSFHLIEAAAEQMSRAILVEFPAIDQISLEILKPHAPIGLPFQNVSVKVRRKWNKAFIAFGSNMGDRREHIIRSLEHMKTNEQIRDMRVSDIMESAPYGKEDQDRFLNGVAELRTVMRPEELLKYLQSLEQEAGRERRERWGPRTLDLDILLYGDLVIDTPELTVPHYDMHNRDFVLKPLAQLSPYLLHPLHNRTIKQMYEELQETHIMKGNIKDNSMQYITTYTKIHFYPLDPKAEDLNIEDIAHALSMLTRANGHFPEFYSVGQHSVGCCEEAIARGHNARIALACLLHDASEAYLSDITRPVKGSLPEYKKAEKRLQDLIDETYIGALTDEERGIVKEIDNAMLYHEFLHYMQERICDEAPVIKSQLSFFTLPFEDVETAYLSLFQQLVSELPSSQKESE